MLEKLLAYFLLNAWWLVPLLRTYWVLATVAAVLALLPLESSALKILKEAVLQSAARGKLWEESSVDPSRTNFWATAWSKSVPQRYFAHFYLVGALFNAALLTASTSASSVGAKSLRRDAKDVANGAVRPQLLALCMLETHLLRRLWETVMLSKYSKRSQMHIMGYLFGLSYYVAVPLSILLQMPGTPRWQRLIARLWGRREAELEARALMWQQAVGVFLFSWGTLHQHRCHRILAQLRDGVGSDTGGESGGASRKEGSPTGKWRRWFGLRRRKTSSAGDENGKSERAGAYRIPHGDWFRLVSSPHYLAEIVIYLGFFVLGGGNDPTLWLLLAWVVSNLMLAGGQAHKWYKQKFKEYPPNRRALFPMLY